jgi:ATP-dependent RNA circularization protein (DNA/RNA ligase family)
VLHMTCLAWVYWVIIAVNDRHIQLATMIDLQLFNSLSEPFLYSRAVRESFQMLGTRRGSIQSANVREMGLMIICPRTSSECNRWHPIQM